MLYFAKEEALGIYVKDLEKPKKCKRCLLGGFSEDRNKYFCAAKTGAKSAVNVGDGEKVPEWCPIEEVDEETVEVGRYMKRSVEDKGGKIIINTPKKYKCNRKRKPCNASPACGVTCTMTLDREYAANPEE